MYLQKGRLYTYQDKPVAVAETSAVSMEVVIGQIQLATWYIMVH